MRSRKRIVALALLCVLAVVFGLPGIATPKSRSVSLQQSSSSSFAPPPTVWSQTYGDTGREFAQGGAVQTSDGGYALAGRTNSFGAGSFDFWLVKTYANGTMQWNQTYGGADNDGAHSVVQTSDGGYALAGYTWSSGEGKGDFWLIKTNSTGNMQWSQTYGGNNSDYPYSVVQTSDGGYAIAGYTKSFGVGYEDFWLVKTYANGTMQWSQTYGDTLNDFSYSMVQTSDGGYALAGSKSFGGFSTFWLVKTDANGNLQMNQTYGIGYGSSYAFSVVQTSDGGYALAGEFVPSGPSYDPDVRLVKTDANGTTEWHKTFGGAHPDAAWSIVQTVDGGYAVAGYTESSGAGNSDFWLIKTYANGTMQWNQTYGGGGPDVARSVVQTFDGGYAVAGESYSYGPGMEDIWLVRLGSAGPDSDGDWLYDSWETDGIDYDFDGTIDLVLPGADPEHKDLYIEIDYMGWDGTHDHNPDPNALADVVNAFANAPVSNPDSVDGITLHMEVDESIPHQNVINVWDDFNNIKDNRFGTAAQRGDSNSVNILAARKMAYRYTLFVHQYALWNGISWVPTTSSGIAELPGNDFIVSLGAFTNNTGTRDQQAGTLMHEFGHTLGLKHGGGDHINGKPNYLSVMSYSRQFSDLIPGRRLDYSRAELPTLNESNLNENPGIQGPAGDQTVSGPPVWNATTGRWQAFVDSSQGPIDWNRDGVANDTGVSRSINDFTALGFGDNDLTMLEGYDDWANILYNFRSPREFSDGFHLQVADQEITWEIVEQMKNTTVISSHDIAVTNVVPSKTIVGVGYSASVNIAVVNQGYFEETFNVTVYADKNITVIGDEITIGNQTASSLTSGTFTVLTFTWNTTGVSYGNYTITAYSVPVSGEIDEADNSLVNGVVMVAIPGDVNGDRTVDILDAGVVSAHWYPGPPVGPLGYGANADINNDGEVDIFDAAIVSAHWLQTW